MGVGRAVRGLEKEELVGCALGHGCTQPSSGEQTHPGWARVGRLGFMSAGLHVGWASCRLGLMSAGLHVGWASCRRARAYKSAATRWKHCETLSPVLADMKHENISFSSANWLCFSTLTVRRWLRSVLLPEDGARKGAEEG